MSVVINTNVDSIKIQNCLTSSTNKLSQAMERMSTGLKINNAKDDAAGTIISAKMGVQLSGNKIAQNNVQNGNALLSTVEGNLNVVQDNLTRIRDLALQSHNGTYSETEVKAMQDEVQQRIDEINRVSDNSKYSSLYLFEDAAGIGTKGLVFQVGANREADNTIEMSADVFKSVKFSTVTGGLANFNLKNIATDRAAFSTQLGQLDDAIDNITTRKATVGSIQNRLDSALDTLTTQYTNLSAAKSIITDANIADEASKYTQNNILQQVSTSLLAQANQAPSIALSLV